MCSIYTDFSFEFASNRMKRLNNKYLFTVKSHTRDVVLLRNTLYVHPAFIIIPIVASLKYETFIHRYNIMVRGRCLYIKNIEEKL